MQVCMCVCLCVCVYVCVYVCVCVCVCVCVRAHMNGGAHDRGDRQRSWQELEYTRPGEQALPFQGWDSKAGQFQHQPGTRKEEEWGSTAIQFQHQPKTGTEEGMGSKKMEMSASN